MLKSVPVTSESPHCSTCMMANVCLPTGMSTSEIAQLDDLVKERLRIEKGQALFQHGKGFDALFALRSGSIKTQMIEACDQHQITGFFLPGEVVGLDGMMQRTHSSTAVAMEDSEVCVIKLADIDEISRRLPILQHQVRLLMSKEIARSHHIMLALGSMRSEQRLATFLINLSQRLTALGYSSIEFSMRMSREEIGNYLGLTLETISRVFSRFARDGVMQVHQREIKILDMVALNELVDRPF